ncbi:hypothetical protein N7509_000377 [Penicillium cosmopolitanum]|uniref:Hydrophobin n=1 Tax=Penicillium cosmopolitanum TaxID=1131564 RepID=A0A9X0BE45_9EURO|nr:uncharacterized protein N7509_000377 [Penicillium cosmopolitanum]KAJ5413750.1 hypothetical protein N7509_000377 [Penicillium cosmopolitanum]
MKLSLTSLAIMATIVSGSVAKSSTCDSDQIVICRGNGNGGLLSLGNIAPGLLGDNCSGGDVYCCSEDDVEQIGLINLDLNAQCTLNRVL